MEKILTKEGKVNETARLISVKMGEWCEIGAFSGLQNVIFGDYSYCCNNCIIQNADIGKFSNIAAAVRIGATDHPMERPSLHHFTYRSKMYGFDSSDDQAFFGRRTSRLTVIGHDTWIGHGAMIKAGIRVGHGAIIGQGSVVTKDVPNYAIVAGNPARIIRYRFPDPIIEALLVIKWWNWSHEKIKANFKDFRGDIIPFVEKHLGKVGI